MARITLNDAAEADWEIKAVLLDSSKGPVVAAAEITGTHGFPTWESSVRKWRQRYDSGADAPADAPRIPFSDADRAELHTRLDDVLDESNADPSRVQKLKAVKWDGMIKNAAKKIEKTTLYGMRIETTERLTAPAWPLVQRAGLTEWDVSRFNARATPRDTDQEWAVACILPDLQAGFYRGRDDILYPLHDPVAISVALQIVEHLNPDLILVGGDGTDFAELGKYRLSPVFARTVQATIDWAERFAAELRRLAPGAAIQWLEGNHEVRMSNYLMDNAKAAFGIHQGGDVSGWPVLTLPHLARFDDHGVNYIPGYPAADYWFNDRIKAMHGDKVNSNGSTVHRYLATERVSSISFHIHRRELGSRTRDTRNGARTIMAASPGCLCSLTGIVPSVKGGVDLDGVPIRRAEDWQQGMAVLRYGVGNAPFVYEQIDIQDGWAMYHGKLFRAGE